MKSPNRERYPVVIVGSGFAGLVAANLLAGHDVPTLLLDENIHIGGQLLRHIPERLGSENKQHRDYAHRIGFSFKQRLKQQKIVVKNRTRVLGIYPGKELLVEEEEKECRLIQPEIILLATGARERFLPFPGWTLPGVISTGAMQVFIKSSGILPARQVFIGGSGLFLLAVAYEVLTQGGKVQALCEQTAMPNKVAFLPQLLCHLPKLSEGARFLTRLTAAGVLLKYRTRILAARGQNQLEEVVTARVDIAGNTISGSERTHRADLLAVGYGFVPNIELVQLAGCRLRHDLEQGGWLADVKEDLETSQENIFAAGEITGIAGALKSIHEGEMAAWAILFRLGKIGQSQYQSRLGRLVQRRYSHLRFGRLFNSLFRIPQRLVETIPDDTVVCRCEDVTMGEIRRAIANGYTTPAFLKIAVRVGMGDCQGRTCGPILYDILSALTGNRTRDLPPLSVRPPIKPVAIDSLACGGFVGR